MTSNKNEVHCLDILNNILRLMYEKSIPQKQLADYLGIKNYQISEWKNGKTKSYMKYLPEIAKFLGVTMDELSDTAKEKAPEVEAEDIDMELYRRIEALPEDMRGWLMDTLDRLEGKK